MSSGVSAEDQVRALDFAFPHVCDWAVAIDAGAHRGDWSDIMSRRFGVVYAFEPSIDMVEKLRRRFAGNDKVVVRHAAVWIRAERVSLVPDPEHPLKTYGRFVQPNGDVRAIANNVEAIAIDDMELPRCGLIKLDLEGAEMAALEGARETIKRCRPVMIVECKARIARRFDKTADDPGRFLAEFGAKEVRRHGPDRLYAFGASA